MKINKSLKKLYLDFNNIKNINKLGECLKLNKSLTYLNLNHNNLTYMTKLYEGLEENNTLKELYLVNINKPLTEKNVNEINRIEKINKNIYIEYY